MKFEIVERISHRLLISLILFIQFNSVQAAENHQLRDDSFLQGEIHNLRSTNGKLYAYTVFLFNDNIEFVNLIQKDTIPVDVLGNESLRIKEYKSYLETIKDPAIKKLAHLLLALYLEPKKYSDIELRQIEKTLADKFIIVRFSKNLNMGPDRLLLDYCIYGRKTEILVKHPLLEMKEKIYNIQPFIYYDELSTSNSTFYFDMIYINPDEVQNDYIIASKIKKGENIRSMFFVGSRVSDNIRYCLWRSFKDNPDIKDEITRMLIIHELTHKILHNKYTYVDQVVGEELSLGSTIYANAYLGMSVLYSYLNYNTINPHRIAAMNFIKYIASKTGKNEFINNPGRVKYIPEKELKAFAKEHFEETLKKLNDQ